MCDGMSENENRNGFANGNPEPRRIKQSEDKPEPQQARVVPGEKTNAEKNAELRKKR